MNYRYYAGNRCIWSGFSSEHVIKSIYLLTHVICMCGVVWYCHCNGYSNSKHRWPLNGPATDHMKIDLFYSYFSAIVLRRRVADVVTPTVPCIYYATTSFFSLHCIHNGHSFCWLHLRENENANLYSLGYGLNVAQWYKLNFGHLHRYKMHSTHKKKSLLE